MYCRQCGTRVDDAPFCPKCGAACAPQAPAGRGRLGPGRRSIVAVGIAFLILAGGVLAFFRLHHPPPSAAQPAAPSAPATTEAPAAEGSLSSGFKWSGLSPDQIRDARSALDLAIAREEQTAHAPAGNAATKDQLGAAPNGTKDGVRL